MADANFTTRPKLIDSADKNGFYVCNVTHIKGIRVHDIIAGPFDDRHLALSRIKEMKPKFPEAYVAIWDDLEDTQMVDDELYCVAKLGNDGKAIPGSRLSGDFSSPSAVFDARDALLASHPDANVFSSLVVDRLSS